MIIYTVAKSVSTTRCGRTRFQKKGGDYAKHL